LVKAEKKRNNQEKSGGEEGKIIGKNIGVL
jgi:hypothetical protein